MRIIVLIILLINVSSVFAQEYENEPYGFEKKDFTLTGSISFNSFKDDENNKSNSFSINPKAGYFISNKLSIGFNANFSIENRNELVTVFISPNLNAIENADIKVISINPEIYTRYYFNPNRKISFFGELALGYITNTIKVSTNGSIINFPGFEDVPPTNTKLKERGFSLRFLPGLNYFISKSFALETSIGLMSYSKVEPKNLDSASNNIADLRVSFSSLSLGVVYKFK